VMKTFKTREEWLQERKSYIGGSDASSIVGMNPYKTNIELWQEKTRRVIPEDISEKPYVKYGHDAEEHLRELFRLDYPQFEVMYKDGNMWLNSDFPWAHASLDGWLMDKETGRKGILEIKTTNILQSMQKEKWKDRIPDNYYCQVLHYLAVTGFDFVVLKAQLKTEFENQVYLQTKHYYIDRSEVEEDIQMLMEEEKKFYECIKNNKRPALKLADI